MHLLKFLGLLLLGSFTAFAQQPVWDSYEIEVPEEGRIIEHWVDMDLVNYAPWEGFEFFVKAKLHLHGETLSNGAYQVSDEEREAGLALQEEMVIWFSEHADNAHAGRIKGASVLNDWLYTNDTVGLYAHLQQYYTSEANGRKVEIKFEHDPEWTYYLDLLYPDEDTQEKMANQKVINQLLGQGDKLDVTRSVDHWLFFTEKSNRKLFRKWAEAQGFVVQEEVYREDLEEMPFGIKIQRSDAVAPAVINPITLSLKAKAAELGGVYDGWETRVTR